jgi:hypothetical protein
MMTFKKYVEILLMEKFDPDMGHTKLIDPNDLIEYINRIIKRRDDPKSAKKDKKVARDDYLRMPHIHASIADRFVVRTDDNIVVDIDKFRDIIMERPRELLKQNTKMITSSTEDTEYFNTSLPALKGLVVDEDTGEFRIVDTCPSAGDCKIKCYAKHNSYVLFVEATISQNKTLNYLFNDAESYEWELEMEIKKRARRFKNKKQVQIRWNDSGDLLSPKYFDIVMRIVNNTPMVDHYIYTKEVEMIKAYPNPPKNVIFNFSFGGSIKQEKLIDINKDKYSRVVNTQDKIKEPILNTLAKFKYIYKNKGEKAWKYGNLDATKQTIAQRYNLDPKTFLSVDELRMTPKSDEKKYNVIVLPGESDVPASRRDVGGTFLIVH